MINHEKFIEIIQKEVAFYEKVKINDVFIVWSCKTLQNSKALLSARNKGAKYYEFTLNGDEGVIYVDCYNKAKHYEIGVRRWVITKKM